MKSVFCKTRRSVHYCGHIGHCGRSRRSRAELLDPHDRALQFLALGRALRSKAQASEFSCVPLISGFGTRLSPRRDHGFSIACRSSCEVIFGTWLNPIGATIPSLLNPPRVVRAASLETRKILAENVGFSPLRKSTLCFQFVSWLV